MPNRPSGVRPSRAKRPAQILALLLAFMLAVSAGGAVMAGLTLPVVIGASSTAAAGTRLFEDLPDEIQIDMPSQRSVMTAADGTKIAEFYADNRIVVPLEDISPYIQKAVVATEDRRFYEHRGIDPEGIGRAVVNNALRDDTEGASTLTQQYVKNALIERARVAGDDEGVNQARAHDYGRKMREAKLAVTLEKHATKEEILAGYLNIAPFGPSVYGVEAASLHYFSKHAKDLTLAEASLIAGITQSPVHHDPVRNPEAATARRAIVLASMERDGYITKAEREEAEAQSVEDLLNVTEMRQGCSTAGHSAFFCEYVTHLILNDEHFGKTAEDRRRLLYRGGLTIKTTLDPAKQKAAYDAVVGAIPIDDPSGIDAALVSVEPGTGKVLAMAQNSLFGDPTEAKPHAMKLNLSVGTKDGGGEGFHTGSTGKIFALVEWLRSGRHLTDRVRNNHGLFTTSDFANSCDGTISLPSGYRVKNMETGPGGATMSVLDATKYSVNRPFVDMGSKLDLCNIAKTANDLGAVSRGNGEPLETVPSMVLGTNTLTPLTMANVGATLAASGKRCEPIAITEVIDADGNAIDVQQPTCEQTIPQNVARTAVYAMQQVVSPGGTGSRAILPGRPAAGKTGTSNSNYHAWFVGFTPQLSAAVWMGHGKADKSMSYQRVNGRWVGMFFGGLIPAPTWKAYMEVATNGMPVEQFPPGDASLIRGPQDPRERPADQRSEPSESPSPEESEEAQAPDATNDANAVAVPNVVGYTQQDARVLLQRAGFAVTIGAGRTSEWRAGVVAGQSTHQAAKGATITLFPSTGP
ncbi:MAG: penicillin-binding protein [Bowdeniella nasicola]|nr:penicillin-binding protein [Bowdeniella nasicola]